MPSSAVLVKATSVRPLMGSTNRPRRPLSHRAGPRSRGHSPSRVSPRYRGLRFDRAPFPNYGITVTVHKTRQSRPPFNLRCELLHLARNNKNAVPHATNRPDGQISSDLQKWCQAPKSKIFRFTRDANHRHDSARLTRKRGGSRSSTNVAVGCGGRRGHEDERG